MKKTIVAANWKMNPLSLKEAQKIFSGTSNAAAKNKKTEVIVCPPFPYLAVLNKKRKNVKLGAQNCHWEEKGAFTGEISPLMLSDMGIDYVILGHSERRKYQKETDRQINKKIASALKAGLKVILCVGETEAENKKGKTASVLKKQLQEGLEGIKDFKKIVTAYEPVWAIGTGKSCDTASAEKIKILIKKLLKNKTPVLYGGSVNSQNARSYVKEAKFDGLLVGGASLKPAEFSEIIRQSI